MRSIFSRGFAYNALMATIMLLVAGCAATSETASSPESNTTPLSICMPWSARTPQHLKIAISVREPSGAPVGGLQQSDFAVHSPTEQFKIDHFLDSSSMHKSIVVAIDSSGSMKSKLVNIENTLGEFMNGLNSCDEVALVAFGGNSGLAAGNLISTLQPFTTDHTLVTRHVLDVQPFGETPLYDGISQGLKVMSTAHYPNRLLIVITDGIDNNSSVSKQQVEAQAREVGHPVYLIGIGDPNAGSVPLQVGPFKLGTGMAHIDVAALDDIANATGGKAFIVPEMDEDEGQGFAEAMRTITAVLGGNYIVFVDIPPSSGWNMNQAPTVSIPSRPNAVVRAQVMPPTLAPAS